MTKLIARRVPRDAHPFLIEVLRNLYIGAIAALSTRALQKNTEQQQQDWWAKLDHDKVQVHFYSPKSEPWYIVGFSMVTDRGNFCTPMFALSESEFGKGYGQEIIEHYLSLAYPKPLHGSQLVSNGAICHLNARNGWLVIREENGVQTLFHPNGSLKLNEFGIAPYPQSVYDEIVRYHGYGE